MSDKDDVSTKETRKKKLKSTKGLTNVESSIVVPGDNTESDCRGICKDTVPDIEHLQITKKTGAQRKRSRLSMNAADMLLLEQSDDGNNKKCRSVESGTGRNDAAQKVTMHMCVYMYIQRVP